MYDAPIFRSFMKDELLKDKDKYLLGDIWYHYIFNESDLHSAAWFYIKEYFRRRSNRSKDNIYVRCEPVMGRGYKPDIVVFEKYKARFFIELKMFKKQRKKVDILNKVSIRKDIKKLKSYLSKYDDAREGFLVVIYDAAEMADTDAGQYDNISIVAINLRLNENDRKRTGYDDWRARFDELRERHY